jgi:hypothetical protein
MKLTSAFVLIAVIVAAPCAAEEDRPAAAAVEEKPPAEPQIEKAPEDLIQQIIADAATDPERSERLYEAALVVSDNPKLQVSLLEKSVEYGLKNPREKEDFEAVRRTVNLAAEKDPGRAFFWKLQRVELYRRWYRSSREKEKARAAWRLVRLLTDVGARHERKKRWAEAVEAYREASSVAIAMKMSNKDDVAKLYHRAVYFGRAQSDAQALAAVLEKDPDKAPMRIALVRKLVVDLDDPPGAKKHLNDDVGVTWKTYVPLAAESVDEVKESACKELGDWYYKELARNAHAFAKPNMLRRAKGYYSRFVELHKATDAPLVAVRVALGDVEKELASLEPKLRPERRGKEEEVAEKREKSEERGREEEERRREEIEQRRAEWRRRQESRIRSWLDRYKRRR